MLSPTLDIGCLSALATSRKHAPGQSMLRCGMNSDDIYVIVNSRGEKLRQSRQLKTSLNMRRRDRFLSKTDSVIRHFMNTLRHSSFLGTVALEGRLKTST